MSCRGTPVPISSAGAEPLSRSVSLALDWRAGGDGPALGPVVDFPARPGRTTDVQGGLRLGAGATRRRVRGSPGSRTCWSFGRGQHARRDIITRFLPTAL